MSEIMNNLNLDTDQEKVYLTLLSSGQLSIAEVAKQLGIPIDEVEAAVKVLIDKELVFTNPSIVSKFTAIYPLVDLSGKAKESLDAITALGNEINAYSAEKFEAIDTIVTKQKENIVEITATAKEINRVSTDEITSQITNDFDNLISEISQILNVESIAITQLAQTTTTEINKHHQETSEKAGNFISSAVSDVVNSLADAESNITKSFEESSNKVQNASETMKSSLLASLDNNQDDYHKAIEDIQSKIGNAVDEYDKSANDNMNLSRQIVNDNYSAVVETVTTKLGSYDKQTSQILEERIRNISDSLNEMSEEFSKVVRDRLNAVRREYAQMVETFTRNVETMFTDANTQLEGLITAKSNSNSQKLDNLFKLMSENLEKSAQETTAEIRNKEVRVNNELKGASEASQRKMLEFNEKLTMELTNNLNKAKNDFDATNTNMTNLITRSKTDIDTKFMEARDSTQQSIAKEFKDQETIFTNTGSKIVDDLRALNTASENKSRNVIKETEQRGTSAIANIEMPSKTLLNRSKQAALKHIQEQSAVVTDTIDKTHVGIEDTIIAEMANVKTQFKGYGDQFKGSTKTIEKMLASLELSYRELITKVKESPRPSLNTVTLIGEEAVLNQMKAILDRVKSTVTLVYPEIKNIHLNQLLDSNPRCRIIVISDFDPFKNADVIRQLMSKENIQLKSLAIGATNKPYYAIGRDGEEGLIATLDESGEVTGITSNSTAFVELISAEIINTVLTPKTKRVTLPDNNQS
ncbi:MAG: helix-turn-helix domain-containing protein [Candidatus Heimdallarchaeota archaeon]